MKRKAANHSALIPPFPYLGSKAGAAAHVWEYLGNPDMYIEPFAGSLAVLLWRPEQPRVEVVNDADGHICNVWRSIRGAPGKVAKVLKRPLSEIDVFAMWERLNSASLVDKLKADLDYCVPELAGFWIAGANLSVGRPWCSTKQKPRLNLGRKEWFFQDRNDAEIHEYLERLAGRLRHVVMYCGSWERALSRTGLYTTRKTGVTGIFLDPPYLTAGRARAENLYAKDSGTVAHDVSAWCREHGTRYRIVLAGYADHYSLPGWTVKSWKRFEGFAAYDANGDTLGKSKEQEALFLSPSCVKPSTWRL